MCVEVGRPGPPERGGVEAERRAPVLLERRSPASAAGAPAARSARSCSTSIARRGAVVGDDRRHRRAGGPQVGGADVGAGSRPGRGPDVEEVAEERVRRSPRSSARAGRAAGPSGRGGSATAAPVPCITSHMSSVGSTSRQARWVTASGWSRPARKATSAPRSWPASANRSWPSARGEGDDVGGHGALGVGVRVRRRRACRWRRSRAGRGRSRCGRRARSAATCRHIRWVCGKPCSSTIGLPVPPTAAWSDTPSATATRW